MSVITVPPTPPTWASNVTFATGPDVGQATKRDPGGGVYPDGFKPGQGAPGGWVNFLFDNLIKWVNWLSSASYGALVWGGCCHSDGDGTAGVPAVHIDSIESVTVSNATLKAVGPHTIVLADYDPAGAGYPLGALAANEWYFVYIGYVGGLTTWQFSLAFPSDTAGGGTQKFWKTGAIGTLRYLQAFRTDAAGVPLPFFSSGTAYYWRRSAYSFGSVAVFGGNALSNTTLALQLLVHPLANFVILELSGINTSATNQYGQLFTAHTDVYAGARIDVPANTTITIQVEMQCTTSQTIDYMVSNASLTLAIKIVGWRL